MEKENKTDKELVQQLTNNNELAFIELYVRYKDRLLCFCLNFIKSRDEAEDLVQELFLFIWESRFFLKPHLSFSSYLYTIAHHRILNYFRKIEFQRKVENLISEQLPQEEDVIISNIVFNEYQEILKLTISKLPPKRQCIFNMSREMNLSHKEIAESLNISIYTVQEHISESLRFIKKQFSKCTDVHFGGLLFILQFINITPVFL